jgi:hypothetical protein
MKISNDSIHDFLAAWKNPDVIDDFVIAHDSGYTDICVYLAQCWGCFEGNTPVEKAILSKRISHKKFSKLIGECFKGVVIMTNPETNETWWIPTVENQGLDYYVSEYDCIKMGYTDKHVFGL